MMTRYLFGKIAAFSLTIWTALVPLSGPLGATDFGEREMTQSQFVAIARPYGQNKYDLLILYQIPGQRPCWSEKGEKPTTIDPLLLNFDFTGICERSTDSNGYSIRIDHQDYGLDYLLRIVERNGELLLIGTPRQAKGHGERIIGRTYGLTSGLLKISLNPGWQFSKRTYQGQVLNHVYLTGDSQAFIPEPTTVVTNSKPITPPSGELIFTAPSTPTQPPKTATLPPIPPQRPETASLPPVPPPIPPQRPETATLPPLPPPPSPNAAIVPPPPPGARKNLSDVLGSLNGNTPVKPAPSKGFKVLARADNGQQQTQLRSLYPDAFRTSYNGRSLWQIGVFSTQENANQVLESLSNAGLSANVIPF